MAIPILPVRDLAEAAALWAGAGLTVERYDDGYAFVLESTGKAPARRPGAPDDERADTLA